VTKWCTWCWRAVIALAAAVLVSAGTVVVTRFFERRTREARKLHLAAPCVLRKPAATIARMFAKEYGREVAHTFGDHWELVDRIGSGEIRADLFLSAGELETDELAARDLIEGDSVRAFGEHGLLLIAPKGNPRRIESVEDLAQDRVRSVAVPNPEKTAVGRGTKQALASLGIWGAVEPKTEFPSEAISGISRVVKGEVDASFALDGCAFPSAEGQMETELLDIIERLPSDSHDRIFCVVAKLKPCQHRRTAEEFIQYLLSPEIQKRLPKLGVPNVRPRGEGQEEKREASKAP